MVLSFNEWAKNKESVLEEGLEGVQHMGDYYVKEFNSPGTGQAGLQVYEVRGRREGVIYFTGAIGAGGSMSKDELESVLSKYEKGFASGQKISVPDYYDYKEARAND